MKVIVNINGKDTEIELTADQVQKVKKATEKITDRIKTFQDVLEVIGEKRTNIYFKACENCSLRNIANKQVELICEVLNEDWVADPFDTEQYKYYPYFEVKKKAFVFRHSAYWSFCTHVPAGLCFKSSELAIYAGKQFIDIYNNLLK